MNIRKLVKKKLPKHQGRTGQLPPLLEENGDNNREVFGKKYSN